MISKPSSEPPLDPALIQRVRDRFRDDPSQMTMMTAKVLGIDEKTVLQALEGAWPIVRLRDDCFEDLMRSLASIGPLRVFVRNRAAVMEVVGEFGGFSESGPFFNIQTDTIDMHIFPSEIAAIFAVEKVGHDSDYATYSFQLFDRRGDAAFKTFVWDGFPQIPRHRIDAFRQLVARLKAV